MGLTCDVCGFTKDNNEKINCPVCKNNNWVDSDIIFLKKISTDDSFISSMINLKNQNPIEYQLKISQFKASLLQTKASEENSNKPHCPTCGSTNIEKISFGKKAFGGAMFGIFSSDVRNTMHCKNCGAKW